MPTPDEWLTDYADLSRRVDRQVRAAGGAGLLDDRGDPERRAAIEAELPPPPGRLVDDADRLLDHPPFAPGRAAFLTAQVTALRTVARRLAGERLPFRDYARGCLGIEPEPMPEERLAEAHDRLAAALPRSPGGPLAARFHAWQAAHRLPPDLLPTRLPGLVDQAVAECRARTSALVALPDDEVVDCRLVEGVAFHAAGEYLGEHRSTVHVNRSVPFNVADLLYVVAHESHPGHIAESVVKERELVEAGGCREQQTRFLLSPQFVVSEGLGLHAEAIAFPGDEAQAWLTDHVDRALGLAPDGTDLAGVHDARTTLWGAWGNAAFLVADGSPDAEVLAYLARWALLDDAELAALGASPSLLRMPFAEPYVLAYGHGAELLRPWLAADPATTARRLLTEQLLPTDLAAPPPPPAPVRSDTGRTPPTP